MEPSRLPGNIIRTLRLIVLYSEWKLAGFLNCAGDPKERRQEQCSGALSGKKQLLAKGGA